MNKYVVLDKKNRQIRLSIDDILYIRTLQDHPHQLEWVTNIGIYTIYGSLGMYEIKLNHTFIRCHRAYLVNIRNIREVDKQSRIIYFLNSPNEYNCPISRRQYKSVISFLSESS